MVRHQRPARQLPASRTAKCLMPAHRNRAPQSRTTIAPVWLHRWLMFYAHHAHASEYATCHEGVRVRRWWCWGGATDSTWTRQCNSMLGRALWSAVDKRDATARTPKSLMQLVATHTTNVSRLTCHYTQVEARGNYKPQNCRRIHNYLLVTCQPGERSLLVSARHVPAW